MKGNLLCKKEAVKNTQRRSQNMTNAKQTFFVGVRLANAMLCAFQMADVNVSGRHFSNAPACLVPVAILLLCEGDSDFGQGHLHRDLAPE